MTYISLAHVEDLLRHVVLESFHDEIRLFLVLKELLKCANSRPLAAVIGDVLVRSLSSVDLKKVFSNFLEVILKRKVRSKASQVLPTGPNTKVISNFIPRALN